MDGGAPGTSPIQPDAPPPAAPPAPPPLSPPPAPPPLTAEPDASASGSPGTLLGQLWNTYYYLAVEQDFPGTKDTTLYDASCTAIATVSAKYSDNVCIEGSGRLDTGEIINYANTCSCGRPCPTGGTICYTKLGASFPWGAGAVSNPLVPLRSIAVDKATISLGTVLYLPQLDGLVLPAAGGVPAMTHDGCVRADDIGGAIKGSHIDIFAGSKAMYAMLEQRLPTKSSFSAYHGGDRCAYLAN